jgi:hypothetical protein
MQRMVLVLKLDMLFVLYLFSFVLNIIKLRIR